MSPYLPPLLVVSVMKLVGSTAVGEAPEVFMQMVDILRIVVSTA